MKNKVTKEVLDSLKKIQNKYVLTTFESEDTILYVKNNQWVSSDHTGYHGDELDVDLLLTSQTFDSLEEVIKWIKEHGVPVQYKTTPIDKAYNECKKLHEENDFYSNVLMIEVFPSYEKVEESINNYLNHKDDEYYPDLDNETLLDDCFMNLVDENPNNLEINLLDENQVKQLFNS